MKNKELGQKQQNDQGRGTEVNQEQAFDSARRLIEQAVEIAASAGLDLKEVIAPHCPETIALQDNGDDRSSLDVVWCGVPVIIDNNTNDLFEMLKPDGDPEQKPAFLVTQSTANFVRQDFERYKPSLERMAENWQQEKALVLSEKQSDTR